MLRRTILVLLLLALFISSAAFYPAGQVKTQRMDGIPRISSPASPLKGRIKLEMEKIREINPYDFPQIGFRYFKSIRSQAGEVILYDPFSTGAHLFGPEGKYVRSVSKRGQGPGEFMSNQNLVFHFFKDEIWGSSHEKIARFDRKGELLDEQTFEDTTSLFIENRDIILDETHHLCLKSERLREGERRSIVLESLFKDRDRQPIIFFQTVRDWVVRKDMSVFTNEWGTPNIWFAYCPEKGRIYAALSTEYLITAYDLEGKPLFRIEKSQKPIKIGRREKAILIPWAAENKKEEWALEAFPDSLAAILSLHTLEGGYLAVLRITGPEEVEIDIFDSEGRYIHALEVPQGMSLEQVQFFDRGFATQETAGDYPVYVEYRITNLPAIFSRRP